MLARDQLRAFVERVENVEGEIKALNEDKRDIYSEAKSQGFDVAALKQVVRLRAQDPEDRRTREAVLDTYLQALGMLD